MAGGKREMFYAWWPFTCHFDISRKHRHLQFSGNCAKESIINLAFWDVDIYFGLPPRSKEIEKIENVLKVCGVWFSLMAQKQSKKR